MNKMTKKIYEYIENNDFTKRDVLNCLKAEIEVADDFNILDEDEFIHGFALSLEQLIREAFEDIIGEWAGIAKDVLEEYVMPVIEWDELASAIYEKA